MILSLRVTSPLLLTAALAAQVPVGSAINGSVNGSTTPLVVVDRTPTVTNITGASLPNINGLRIDPFNGQIWMVGTESTALRRGTLNFASASITDQLIATLPMSGPAAIAFDIDSNPVVAGGFMTGSGGLFRVHRISAAVTPLVNSASGLTGVVNAIDEDPATGDLYFGVYETGNVYRISPPYGLNSHVLVGSIVSASGPNLSGLSFARTTAAPTGLLYVTSFATAANPNACLTTLSTSGVATPVAGIPAWADLNWVDYDSVRNDLWLNSTWSARSIYSSTTAGANALVHQLPSGAPACIEVNDVDTTRAELRVCPLNVPSPTASITLQLVVAGNPGEVGVIAMIAPATVLLGLGPIGQDGRFAVSFPAVSIPSGAPDFFRFLAGTVDTTSLIAKFSQPVSWPRN